MIIDCHAHFEPRMLELDRFIAKMDEARVDRVALIPAMNDPLPETPKRLLATMRALMQSRRRCSIAATPFRHTRSQRRNDREERDLPHGIERNRRCKSAHDACPRGSRRSSCVERRRSAQKLEHAFRRAPDDGSIGHDEDRSLDENGAAHHGGEHGLVRGIVSKLGVAVGGFSRAHPLARRSSEPLGELAELHGRQRLFEVMPLAVRKRATVVMAKVGSWYLPSLTSSAGSNAVPVSVWLSATSCASCRGGAGHGAGPDLSRHGQYIRPKWGIYRGKSTRLRTVEETLRFANSATTAGANPSSDCCNGR